jgi:hypothetical protein
VEVTRITLEPMGRSERYAALGLVTNRSAVPWRIREIELRFLNPDGSLHDARHLPLQDLPVVRPASEAAFRLEVGRLPPSVAAASLAARVQLATDGDRPPDPD